MTDKGRVYFKREDELEKAKWFRDAWFTSIVVSCRSKKTIQPKKLLPDFMEEPAHPKGVLTKEQKEQRHREMLESAAKHKKAFWMKTKGTPDKPRLFGDDMSEEDLRELKKKKGKARSKDAIEVLKFIGGR